MLHSYTMHFLDKNKFPVLKKECLAADDGGAIGYALASSETHVIELFQGPRLIARIPKGALGFGPIPRLDLQSPTEHAPMRGALPGPEQDKRALVSLSKKNADLVELLEQAGTEQEAQKAEARTQDALMQEIHHRTKNMLAMVAAIVRQTLRSAASLADAENSLSMRLMAMAAAHDALLERDTKSASFTHIVQGALAQHFATPSQLAVCGPEMEVIPSAALPLALLLNELATNATKHGALSNPAGRVSLRWVRDVETSSFYLWWEESGGPLVEDPRNRGLGSRLLEQVIPGQFGGEALLSFPATGVRYALRARLPKIEHPRATRGFTEASQQ